MQHDDWQKHNLAAIMARLAPLRHLTDGPIYDEPAGMHHIRIIKTGSQLALYFVDRGTGVLEGPMSRLDLDRPLLLLAGYTQAALLALVWRPKPQRVCALGLAGGRISMLLHHHLPTATIDNVELDPAFATVAPAYFGLAFDERQRLELADARQFLEQTGERYDIILMDAFRDGSDQLDRLGTKQFYGLCARRLARGGVICANILRSDPRYAAKLAGLSAQFKGVRLLELKHSLVVFGSDQRLGSSELMRRAADLERRHGFEFPYLERAAGLRSLRELPAHLYQQIRAAQPLDDDALAAGHSAAGC
jgi:spermidine synthase